MRQQVIKAPLLEINVIMNASRRGLSGLGSERRQEEEGAANIMFHQQRPLLTQQVENKQGLPAAFHQQLQETRGKKEGKERKEVCNTCSRVLANIPWSSGLLVMHSINPCE